MEPWVRNDMSPEAKENNLLWIGNLWQQYLETISGHRGIPLEDLSRAINQFADRLDAADGDFARFALELGLVDRLISGGAGVIINSEGATGMQGCWGKKAKWVDYSGTLAGSKVGLTIMDHPGNLRYPTTWHVRDYGLFAANPFGLHDFLNDPKVDGSYTVKLGTSLVFRYRILIHPGDSQEAGIPAEYQSYLDEVP